MNFEYPKGLCLKYFHHKNKNVKIFEQSNMRENIGEMLNISKFGLVFFVYKK